LGGQGEFVQRREGAKNDLSRSAERRLSFVPSDDKSPQERLIVSPANETGKAQALPDR
jgi:hypothetical protein